MKLLWNAKDGGPESRVWCWGLESKRFGSVLLLLFRQGTREAFHSHAFNAVSWVLKGFLQEKLLDGSMLWYPASLSPILTRRETTHKVAGLRLKTWVLSFRGPWAKTWNEITPAGALRLTHGRKPL